MKRKYLFPLLMSVLLSSYSSISSADWDTGATTCFEGFYLGLGIGYDWGTLNDDASTNFQNPNMISPPTFFLSNFIDNKFDTSIRRTIGDLFVGYGVLFGDSFYVGPELWLTYGNKGVSAFRAVSETFAEIPTKSDVLTNQSNISLGHLQGGLDLRLGYAFLQSTLLYAKFGLGLAGIDTNTTGIADINDVSGFVATADITSSESKKVIGARFGVGVEQHLSCNWSLRGDYTFSTYRADTSKFILVQPSMPPRILMPATLKVNTSGRAYINSLILSVIYTFS